MSSYFAKMFSGDKFNTFLMHVNSLGGVVIYALDRDGMPTDMVQGTAEETIGQSLKSLPGWTRVVSLQTSGTSLLVPAAIGLRGMIWGDVCCIMNRKGLVAKEQQTIYSVYDHLFNIGYIERDRGGRYLLTDAGTSMDVKLRKHWISRGYPPSMFGDDRSDQEPS